MQRLERSALCDLLLPPHSYPAVLVVPSKVTDESLATLAGQFQHNRWPVVTWKHPRKEAVLLRSSSFVPSSITRKKFHAMGGIGSKLLPSLAQKQAASDEAMQNKAGVGVYNKDVETYFYDLMLVSPNNHPSLDLVQQISIPPPIMEFEELRRQGSIRLGSSSGEGGAGGLPPPSPSPSAESVESEHDPTAASKGGEKGGVASGGGGGIRNRAATYAFKIRTRVGSSVSQLSRVAVPDKKQPVNSPAAKRKLSASRYRFSSPQLPRKSTASEDSISRHSSCSTASDLSMEKAKWRESLKEEPDLEISKSPDHADKKEKLEEKEKQHPKSASTSPTAKRPSHKRTRSSDGVIDLKSEDIDLKDIVISERTSASPEPNISPIDWEAVGNVRPSEKVRWA